jgi:hypothetical protein
MKECPVCNETFQDDYKFCDLDGSPLSRLRDASSTSDSSRTWSLLGVVLLLGAVGISVGMIVFKPRGPAIQTRTESLSSPASSTQRTSDSTGHPITPQEFQADSAALEAEAKRPIAKQAAQPAVPASSNGAVEGAAPVEIKPVAQTPSEEKVSKPAGADQTGPAGDAPASRSGDAAISPTQPADPSKDQKARPKEASKETADKKGANKEKKGGFLKVFKKIFGKS